MMRCVTALADFIVGVISAPLLAYIAFVVFWP